MDIFWIRSGTGNPEVPGSNPGWTCSIDREAMSLTFYVFPLGAQVSSYITLQIAGYCLFGEDTSGPHHYILCCCPFCPFLCIKNQKKIQKYILEDSMYIVLK
jgi:hypothetical protein